MVDPIDELDFDLFARLTADNMRYGPVQRAPGEPLVLARPGNSAENMVQGEFGTCYLLSVLQCQSMMLSEFYPPQNIVQAYDMSAGVFACRFWHLGQWRIVVVDDAVPCRKSRKQPGMIYAIGAECRDGKSIFLPIVEKAYGKLMGYSYRCVCLLARFVLY